MDRTISVPPTPGDTTTSWISFKEDTLNFRAVTLPLCLSGVQSTTYNPHNIDHICISNEMVSSYVAASASVLRTEVESWVASYGNTTSRNYPVMTKYVLTNSAPPLRIRPQQKEINWTFVVTPNNTIRISVIAEKNTTASLWLTDLSGRVFRQQQIALQKGNNISDMMIDYLFCTTIL